VTGNLDSVPLPDAQPDPPLQVVDPHQPPDDAVTMLGDPSAKKREEALQRVTAATDPQAIAIVSTMLRADENANVRKAAATALGRVGPPGLGPLEECLGDTDEQRFIRIETAHALGALHDDAAIGTLSATATSATEPELQEACIQALRAVASPAAADALAHLVPAVTAGYVQAEAITALGRIGSAEHAAVLSETAHSADDRVRKATASALGALRPDGAVAILGGLVADPDPGVRARAATILAAFDAPATASLLARALLDDVDPRVRAAAASGIAGYEPTVALTQALLDALDGVDGDRGDLDAVNVGRALAPAMTSGLDGGRRLPDLLIAAALDADEHRTALLAEILLACCARDSSTAGELINRYAREHPDSSSRLDRLRIELGGQKALDPILEQIREDLKAYFQVPVAKLNRDTTESWQDAIERARLGFLVRMIMSVVVFAIGVVLVLASSAAFLLGNLDTTAAWGAGGTFVGGLAAMLAVTYTGPLKDIRQSINDLGVATVSFIGYVHQVLQISHTFTALYLRDRITFGDLEKSSALLRAATDDAVKSFTTGGEKG